jgi:hypothetical protein
VGCHYTTRLPRYGRDIVYDRQSTEALIPAVGVNQDGMDPVLIPPWRVPPPVDVKSSPPTSISKLRMYRPNSRLPRYGRDIVYDRQSTEALIPAVGVNQDGMGEGVWNSRDRSDWRWRDLV